MDRSPRVQLEPPRIEDGGPLLFAGIAERYSGGNAGIPAQWQRFVPLVGKIPQQREQTTYGIVFAAQADGFSYLTGVEVTGRSSLPAGLTYLEVPAQRYAVFAHHGHVSTLPGTVHAIMSEWLPASGEEHATGALQLLERYGDGFDPQSGRGEIEIWIPIAASETATAGISTDEEQIRAVVADRAEALRRKDAGRVVGHRAEGFVLFSLAPPLVTPTADDAQGLDDWFATWAGSLGYEIHRLRIAAGGEIAFAHSLNRMRGTKVDGEQVDLWFRQTLGFRKIGGAWKVVHEHESVPFYMDGSYRAAVDLKP